MNKTIEQVQSFWHRDAPAQEDAICKVESELNIIFPRDYREFLHWSNGGEARIGSAYFSLWPIEDIPKRNISASIVKYMSNRFIGIGTNGGGECYAFDYTDNRQEPNFTIVPLGDLSHESKHVISSNLTEAFKKSLNGSFDDGEYNSNNSGPLTQDLIKIKIKNVLFEAEKLWQAKDYKGYLILMESMTDDLSEISKKKIEIARKKL